MHACNALQHVAVRCSMLQCVAACCSALQHVAVRCSMLQCVAVRCSASQCVAVRCSALQCVAVRCRALRHDITPPNTTKQHQLQPSANTEIHPKMHMKFAKKSISKHRNTPKNAHEVCKKISHSATFIFLPYIAGKPETARKRFVFSQCLDIFNLQYCRACSVSHQTHSTEPRHLACCVGMLCVMRCIHTCDMITRDSYA